PVEALDELHPQEDHHPPEDDGAEDAPEEDPVLVELRHREGREDQRDDEEDVHRQALCDQEAREEVDPRFLAEREEDETVEDERQPDPEDRPEERLPIGDLVGLAVEDPEVEGEEDRDQDEEARPERGRYGAKDHRSFSTATY